MVLFWCHRDAPSTSSIIWSSQAAGVAAQAMSGLAAVAVLAACDALLTRPEVAALLNQLLFWFPELPTPLRLELARQPCRQAQLLVIIPQAIPATIRFFPLSLAKVEAAGLRNQAQLVKLEAPAVAEPDELA